MRYAVQDPRHHKTYLTDAEMAARLHQWQEVVEGPTTTQSAPAMSGDDMKTAFAYIRQLRTIGQQELNTAKPFNPLFARVELLQLSRYARSLDGLAAALAPLVLPFAVLLVAMVVMIGVQTDWRIIGASGAAFSLSGLATFAVVSPILKIPHELGHALTARRARVDLGAFGVLFVGLFPLPFVDCSMADVQASRWQRIRISLAGVFVDLMIAGLAFIGWHFAEGQFLQTLWLNIFVFSSLNSLLFNGNPLIRLDGYYAVSDLIGQRNLSTRAARVFKARRRFVTTFGRDGAWERGADQAWLSLYALGSTIYKINILITVFWLVMPRFFGLGAILTLWAGYAMFLSPLLGRSRPPTDTRKASSGWFWLLAGGLGLVLALTPFPCVVTVPAMLDTSGTYALSATEAGFIQSVRAGAVGKGEPIVVTEDPIALQDLALNRAELDVMRAAFVAADGSDATRARMLSNQVQDLEDRVALSEAALAGRVVTSKHDGHFLPDAGLMTGRHVAPGDRLGALIPDGETAILTAPFPESRIEQFDPNVVQLRGWAGGPDRTPLQDDLTSIRAATVTLEPSLALDAETGTRSYVLRIASPMRPTDMIGETLWLRLNLGSQPGYMHLRDRWIDLRAAYRRALIGAAGNG